MMKNPIILLLLIIAILVSGIGGYSLSPSKTTSITLPASTQTVTSRETITLTALNNSPYNITFQQISCNPTYYVAAWSVTLGNQTIYNPNNGASTSSNVTELSSFPSNSTISTITFTVPDGAYNYTVKPTSGFSSSTAGIVKVNGSSVVVQLDVICHP